MDREEFQATLILLKWTTNRHKYMYTHPNNKDISISIDSTSASFFVKGALYKTFLPYNYAIKLVIEYTE